MNKKKSAGGEDGAAAFEEANDPDAADNGRAARRTQESSRLRAQVSLEYTAVSASMLVVLAILMVLFNNIYAQYALKAQYQQVTHAIAVLQAGATDVWKQGKGASQRVRIDIPEQADLSRSNISGNVMRLYLENFGDASAKVDFPVSGNWPTRAGRAEMAIDNDGSQVRIRPAGRLTLNASAYYFSFASANSQTIGLKVRNLANASYAVNYTLTCPAECSCAFSHTSNPYTLNPADTQSPTLQIGSSGAGLHEGYLNVSVAAAAGSGLPSETFILPVQVRVT